MDMIYISPQALDQASVRVRGVWLSTRLAVGGGEGLHAWVLRMFQEALDRGQFLDSGKIRYAGVKFSFIPMAIQRGNQHHQGWLVQLIERVRE